jgi:hypothetical protein
MPLFMRLYCMSLTPACEAYLGNMGLNPGRVYSHPLFKSPEEEAAIRNADRAKFRQEFDQLPAA